MVIRVKSPKGLRQYLFLSLLLGHLLYATCAVSSVIAIVDTGIDTEHPGIRPHLWINPVDLPGDWVDQDGNGKVDDVFGWNFINSSPNLLDRSYLGTINDHYDDLIKFINIYYSFRGDTSKEDLKWFKMKRKDKNFFKLVKSYLYYAHGTHVAGIAASGGSEAQGVKILGLKIPLGENSLSSFTGEFLKSKEDNNYGNQVSAWASEAVHYGTLHSLIIQEVEGFLETSGKIISYLAGHDVDVANFSFGADYFDIFNHLRFKFSPLHLIHLDYKSWEPLIHFYINYWIRGTEALLATAPSTLFVSSAGNNGLSNDRHPADPAGAKSDNHIVVAASYNNGTLASWSNYGVESVHVAAPGVAIRSAVPGGGYLKMSGTSMAAPYVSNVAAIIFDINPSLVPVDVKKIIMETVDVRSSLVGKIKSGGVVNRDRAFKAAELSKDHPLSTAISMSIDLVADPGVPKSIHRPLSEEIEGLVVPRPNPFF